MNAQTCYPKTEKYFLCRVWQKVHILHSDTPMPYGREHARCTTHTLQTLMIAVYLSIQSQAQFRVHSYGLFFLGCPWDMQGHILLEEWERRKKKNRFSKPYINYMNNLLLLLLTLQCFQWLNLQMVCMSYITSYGKAVLSLTACFYLLENFLKTVSESPKEGK